MGRAPRATEAFESARDRVARFIGAAGADINLYCLEASTGLPKWKQFIAQYESARARATDRR